MVFILRRRKLGNTSCREISAKSETGIYVVRNDRNIPNDDLVFRWGCTSNVPTRNVVNTAEAIHLVSDKIEFRKLLEEKSLCPRTWFSIEEYEESPDKVLPVIIRPRNHHQGRNLHLCNNIQEIKEAAGKYPQGYYISKYIKKVSEYRVFVVSGRVVCVAKKTPADANAVAWNVAQGGRFDNVRWDEWPLKAVRMSIEGFNLSGLDFGGVDIMIDAEGECYILEINSAPSLTSPYRQECFSKAFDYIVKNGKQKIPLVEQRGGYLKFCHPAINERAMM